MSIFKKAMDNVGNVVNKAQTGTAINNLESTFKIKENNILQTIQQLKQQRSNIYAKLGQKCFEMRLEDAFSEEKLTEFFDLLLENKSKIEAQEAVLATIKEDFVKDSELLKGSSMQQTAKCPSCNASYAAGIDLFCKECGTDLRGSKPAAAVEKRCPKCNLTYNSPATVFCKHCGCSLEEVK